MDFLVSREDIRQSRFDDAPPAEPGPGQALLEVESFALTANNVSYAALGDAMSYWRFYPAPEGWGRFPVWGFARVVGSSHADLREGERFYGYLPPSTHAVLTADGVDGRGFTEASPHRADLPAIYNAYTRARADGAGSPDEDREALFRPLYSTSFLLDDMLGDRGFLADSTVVMSSASSKTALGTAFLLSRRAGAEVCGLTSPSNAAFLEGLGVYDTVLTYDSVDSLPPRSSVYVDLAGDASVRAAVHRHLGEALTADLIVGASHWDSLGDPGDLPGPAPELFFAPAQAEKRAADWGADGPRQRIGDSLAAFGEWLSGWLRIERGSGPEHLERTYLDLVDGKVDPAAGHVASLTR